MTTAKKTLRGITWSAFERFSVQGLQFAVFVLMARMLTPVDYGLVGMLSIFIVVSQLIAEGGLSQSIIRKLDRNSTDFSTAFYINMAVGVVIYILLFFTAPWLSYFYDEPRLTDIMRVLALSVVIQASLVVHRSMLTAELDFRTQAKSTFAGAMASGAVALYMAYDGYGVWSLVALQLVNQFVTASVLWSVTRWRPRREFSMKSFRKLFDLGSKLLVSNVLESAYNCIYSLVIGKTFSAYALGSYANARQIVSFSSENLTNIVMRAVYPSFCRYQNNPSLLRKAVSDYMRMSFLVIAPLMLGLAAIAEPMVNVLMGWKWLYAAKLLRILCVAFMFYPLTSTNMMVLKIMGNGRLYLRLQAFSIVFGLGCLVAMIPFGLQAVCCGFAGGAAMTFAVTAYYAGRMIDFGFTRQVRALLPVLLNSMAMAGVAFLMQMFMPVYWPFMMLIVVVGALGYIGLTFLFLPDLCNKIMKLVRRKNREPAPVITEQA